MSKTYIKTVKSNNEKINKEKKDCMKKYKQGCHY